MKFYDVKLLVDGNLMSAWRCRLMLWYSSLWRRAECYFVISFSENHIFRHRKRDLHTFLLSYVVFLYDGNAQSNICNLKKKAADSSATQAPIYKSTRRHIPKDDNLHTALDITYCTGDFNVCIRQKPLIYDGNRHEQMHLFSRHDSKRSVENHRISLRNFCHHLHFPTSCLLPKFLLPEGRGGIAWKLSELLNPLFSCLKNVLSPTTPSPYMFLCLVSSKSQRESNHAVFLEYSLFIVRTAW
jgi:hypothetical protein